MAIKFSDKFHSSEPLMKFAQAGARQREEAGAKQREQAGTHRLLFGRGERLRIPAGEVRRVSKVQVSDGEITLKHKSLAAGTYGTRKPLSGTIVKVDPRHAIIELEGRTARNLRSQISVPTRRLTDSPRTSAAGIPEGTRVLLNVAREPDVEPAKRLKDVSFFLGAPNPTTPRWLDVAAAPATAARKPSEVVQPLRNPTHRWRVAARPTQMKMEKYIGTVKATEGDEVLASVTPEGNIDTREVYIPVSSFERTPRPGEKIECRVISGGSITTTHAKILSNASLPKLEDFGLSEKLIKERVSKITFGRSDD